MKNRLLKILIIVIFLNLFNNPIYSYASDPYSNGEKMVDVVWVSMIIGFTVGLIMHISNETNVEMEFNESDSSSNALSYLLKGDSLDYFHALMNEEQRQEFISAFWKNFDPYPPDERNEIRDEFEYRVKLANIKFSNNVQRGWNTAQGRIYILYGEPDEVIQYPFAKNVFSNTINGLANYKTNNIIYWFYNKPGERSNLPAILSSIAVGRTFFMFCDFNRMPAYEQIYSSELDEVNHVELFHTVDREEPYPHRTIK